MRVYTYSEARKHFATVLSTALNEEVMITRKDGNKFKIVPMAEPDRRSPLDVGGLETGIGKEEIVDIIREGRQSL